MVTAVDIIKYIVALHFMVLVGVVAHQDSVCVRWSLVLFVYVLVEHAASFVGRQESHFRLFVIVISFLLSL